MGSTGPGIGSAGEGIVLWLTGLPAAGKSTIARGVEERLRSAGISVEVLDGDELRQTVSRGLGFSMDDRARHIELIAFIANLLSRHGVTVIVAAVSPLRAQRELARAEIAAPFFEVYVRASVAECARRDPNGLYERALTGHLPGLTGVSSPYEAPDAPDVVLDTERLTPAGAVARLLASIADSGCVPAGGRTSALVEQPWPA